MSFNIIEYIVDTKGITQKALAKKLRVSPAQISHWKSGDRIPFTRNEQLMEIAGLFGDDPEWAVFAKTKEDADSWLNYLALMVDLCDNYTQSSRLKEEPELDGPNILLLLSKVGINFPEKPPAPKDIEKEDYEYTNFDELILEYLNCFGPLSEWCALYLESDHDIIYDYEIDISHQMTDYSLCFVEDDLLKENGADMDIIKKYRNRTIKTLKNSITEMAELMEANNIPFRTDYFDLLNLDLGELDDQIVPTSVLKQTITEHFSYSEKLIMNKLKVITEKVDSIDNKLEMLLNKL